MVVLPAASSPTCNQVKEHDHPLVPETKTMIEKEVGAVMRVRTINILISFLEKSRLKSLVNVSPIAFHFFQTLSKSSKVVLNINLFRGAAVVSSKQIHCYTSQTKINLQFCAIKQGCGLLLADLRSVMRLGFFERTQVPPCS
jgi:hypothetical protein